MRNSKKNNLFEIAGIWKRRAEAAERDLHSIIKQVDDGCSLCVHNHVCQGEKMPEV